MNITYQIVGEKQLLEAFQAFPMQVKRNVRVAMKRSMRDIQLHARKNHDFQSRKGFLERAVETRTVSDAPLIGEIFLDESLAPYAPYVHEGTGMYGPSMSPYVIRPKNKKALRWVVGGVFAFSGGVVHPGIERDPFLYRAAAAKKQKVQQNFNDAVKKSIEMAGLAK